MHTVLDDLERNASLCPDKTAYESEAGGITWGQLHLRARQIGSYLLRFPLQSPVLVDMDKGPDCVAAMLGVLYAGGFYTPIDPDMPAARRQLIMSVLKPACVLTAQTLEGCPAEVDAEGLNARRKQLIDTDLMYVLFTSGSTGVPKGVSIPHCAVTDFVTWACETLPIHSGTRFGNQAPLYFDNSVLDVFCAMRLGATVHFIPKKHFLFVSGLLTYLKEKAINTIFWVPSVLTNAARAGVLADCPADLLQNVFFCGEVMPCRTLNAWRRALPNACFVNMYGPTEITDVCCYYPVERTFGDEDVLPIGFPCGNTRVFLLEGEICVTGTCLSSGYYGNAEKTAAAFVQNPLRPEICQRLYKTGDLGAYNSRGELLFLGRQDSQIKRHGYRIELGEIECALNAAAGVDKGCCLYDEKTEKILCVYVGTAEEKAVKRALKEKVPRYMLPDVLLRRETLPETANGKMDRVRIRREWESEHTLL